jgi:DNA-binding transcriptional LysR family regulator
MGLTQPAVSSLIKELERAMGGVSLLDRTTRSLQLTAAGQDALIRAQSIIAETSAMADEAQHGGKVRAASLSLAITAAAAVSHLPGILAQFQSDYPNCRLHIHDVLPQNLLETVLNGSADFGIGTVAAHPGIAATELLSDVLCLVGPAQSPLAGYSSLKWEELGNFPTIGTRRSNVVRPILDGVLAGHGKTFEPAFEVSLASTALALVAAGMGYAVLPRFIIPPAQAAELIAIPLIEPEVRRPLSLFSRKGRVLSPIAKSFMSDLIARAPTPGSH